MIGYGPVTPAAEPEPGFAHALHTLSPIDSPPYSFKGWLFGVWLFKNKLFVKNVLIALVGILPLLATSAGSAAVRDSLIAAAVAVTTLAGKLAVDAFDYFVSENPR